MSLKTTLITLIFFQNLSHSISLFINLHLFFFFPANNFRTQFMKKKKKTFNHDNLFIQKKRKLVNKWKGFSN